MRLNLQTVCFSEQENLFLGDGPSPADTFPICRRVFGQVLSTQGAGDPEHPPSIL